MADFDSVRIDIIGMIGIKNRVIFHFNNSWKHFLPMFISFSTLKEIRDKKNVKQLFISHVTNIYMYIDPD